MKLGLNAKLAIGIIVGFGLLIGGYFAYEPLWYLYMESRLASENSNTREEAAKKIGAEGKRALPHLAEWVKSSNDCLAAGACLALEKIKKNLWTFLIPDVVLLYRSKRQVAQEAASAALEARNHPVIHLIKQKVTLSFTDIPLIEAINFFRDITGLNINIWPAVTEKMYTESIKMYAEDIRVDFRIKDLFLCDALYLITDYIPGTECYICDDMVCIMMENETQNLWLNYNYVEKLKHSDDNNEHVKAANENILNALKTMKISTL